MWRIFSISLLLIIAFIIRYDFLLASNAVIDADEAIVGLMAKHILEGQPIPTFYYGQHYMGSFEALVVAVAFYFFGISNWALLLVPVCFSILFTYLVYILAKEILNERIALLATLFSVFPPAALVIWSTKARGGFIEIMCIGALALITATRWHKHKDKRKTYTIWTGLWLGFGWWVNNQIIYFMLPIGLFFLLVSLREHNLKELINFLFLGLLSFLIASSPYWIYNLKNDFVSLQMFNASSGTDLLEHAEGLVDTALPIIMGGKRFWHTEDAFPLATYFVWFLLTIVFFYYLYYRKTELLNLLRFKIDTAKPLELIFVFFFTCILVFTISSFGYLVKAPRYLLPIYIALFIITAFVIERLWVNKKILTSLFIFTAMLWLSWSSSFLGGRSIPGEPIVFNNQRVSKSHEQLIKWLKDRNYNWVRTNYWIGYRLAFETNEQIKFLVFGEPHETRIKSYENEGLKIGRETMPIVAVPDQAEIVETGLLAQGFKYSKIQLDDYIVIFDIKNIHSNLVQINHDNISFTASIHNENAKLALDNNLDSRWASASPQKAGMTFNVKFKKPVHLKGIRYDTGHWAHDYPRGLKVELVLTDGTIINICDDKSYYAIRYYLHGDSEVTFYADHENVSEVRLIQTGEHPVFDWTIAELSFYE